MLLFGPTASASRAMKPLWSPCVVKNSSVLHMYNIVVLSDPVSIRPASRFDGEEYRRSCGIFRRLQQASGSQYKHPAAAEGNIAVVMQAFAVVPRPLMPLKKRRRCVFLCKCTAEQDVAKTRLRARVAYDGTRYHGWQFQLNGETVQGTLEKVLSRRSGMQVRVVGASRTDAGVHARGQGVHFDVPGNPDPTDLQFALNQMLPPDIRVRDLSIAPVGVERSWHAIYRARGKRYAYRLSTRDVYDPLQNSFRMYEYHAARGEFCEERLRKAADLFVGTQDFTAFANRVPVSASGVRANPIRTVHNIDIMNEGEGHLRIDFNIDGALYKMIRNIVGTMLAVAVGKMEVEDVPRLFEAQDRRLVPKSAPARGLCLEEVFYDDWE